MAFLEKVREKYRLAGEKVWTNNYSWRQDETPESLAHDYNATLLTTTEKEMYKANRVKNEYSKDRLFRENSIKR